LRKTHSTEFKSKLVLEVLRGERTLVEIASENNVHPNMLTRWKTDAVNHFGLLFEKPAKVDNLVKEKEAEIEELYKQIGKLSTQVEWLKKKSGLTV
jgi:transposase-like protein